MQRSSFPVRLARLGQRLPVRLLRPVELPAIKRASAGTNRPWIIILLALPRSGSTLTYQVLCQALRPVYLSNLGHLLYQLPLVALSLSRWRCDDHEPGYVSNEGFVPGMCGPAEGLRFWSYWLSNGIDEREEQFAPRRSYDRRRSYLRKAVISAGSAEAPLVTGYVGHALAVPRLRKAFPEAVFVRLNRDPVSNALSLLRSRRKHKGEWFSVFPRECEQHLSGSLQEQVAAQVYWLNKRLNKGLDENTVEIGYEELCRTPAGTVDRIVAFCNRQGMRLERKRSLPETFSASTGGGDGADDEWLVRTALSDLERRYGPL